MANLGYLQLTRSCYQQCRFCSNPPTGIELTEAEMVAMIDELVESTDILRRGDAKAYDLQCMRSFLKNPLPQDLLLVPEGGSGGSAASGAEGEGGSGR